MDTVLIIDDDRNMRLVLSAMVEKEGLRAIQAEDGLDGLKKFNKEAPDIVLTDLKMPGLDGIGVLERVLAADRQVPVIVLTAHGTVEAAVLALKQGAFDFLTKPFDNLELINVLQKARGTRERASRDARLTAADQSGRMIIGDDPQIENLYRVIKKVAPSPSTVLITGESGTGKELVAREMHHLSGKDDKPFIKINCAAIPENLLESELFGYERGAFTGAVSSKPGRFELADCGTLFLDEIGAMNLDVQAKILQVLQDGNFERVGGIKTITIDTRLIAATNVQLADEIAAGRFREDLYYRLNVVPISLPPLRDRRGDIPQLVRHFITSFNAKLVRNISGIADDALALLMAYDWPGNIRELENMIERTVLLCENEMISRSDLPVEIGGGEGSVADPTAPDAGSMKEKVKVATRVLERDMIEKALKQTDGNVTQAAVILGISRKGLQLKMKELSLRSQTSSSDS